MIKNVCPLCLTEDNLLLYKADKRSDFREFYNCRNCDLVYVGENFYLSKQQEKERYKSHNNDPYDEGYRNFLNRLLSQIKPFLNKDMEGLDYGAGPGPCLSIMMKEEGYKVDIYDPFFHPSKEVLNKRYDFITSTETVEHFYNPRLEYNKFQNLLKSGGFLGIMTSMLDDWSKFSNWHYHIDPTHVVFYSKETFKWIAREYDWEVIFPRKNIIIFKK
ncbi:MAG: class I SAM-dependent methyltransferase [Firmicutes bacterium]|nr:class I SAM-dependent methyltransferase [Bacillota bacterium]